MQLIKSLLTAFILVLSSCGLGEDRCLFWCVGSGGLIVSVLDSGSCGCHCWGHCVVFFTGKKTTQWPNQEPANKRVPANCQGNLTKCWEVTCDGLASHPGGVAILLAASCYRSCRFSFRVRLLKVNTVLHYKATFDFAIQHHNNDGSGNSFVIHLFTGLQAPTSNVTAAVKSIPFQSK